MHMDTALQKHGKKKEIRCLAGNVLSALALPTLSLTLLSVLYLISHISTIIFNVHTVLFNWLSLLEYSWLAEPKKTEPWRIPSLGQPATSHLWGNYHWCQPLIITTLLHHFVIHRSNQRDVMADTLLMALWCYVQFNAHINAVSYNFNIEYETMINVHIHRHKYTHLVK